VPKPKAERIIAEALQRLDWAQADLQPRLKGNPAKMTTVKSLEARNDPIGKMDLAPP
jgi:ribosome-binding protein aMBF1 (putative translation factor)